MRRYASLTAGLVVALALAGYMLATIDRTSFHGDESQWIAKSRGWFDLVAGRFDRLEWGYDSLDQPMFVPYAFGIVAALSGYSAATLHETYDFEKDEETNRRERRVPDDRLLWRCRLVSTVCGWLACAAAMALVWRFGGPIGGLAAGLLLGLNPVYVGWVHRAMADGALSLWLLAGWLACAKFTDALGRNRPRQAWGWAIATGAAGGLAAMTKLTGAIVIMALAGVGLVNTMCRARRHAAAEGPRPAGAWRLPAMTTAAGMAVGYLVFIAQSPLTWRSPIDGPRAMAFWRSKVAEQQQLHYPESAVYGTTSRVRLVATRVWHDYGALAATGSWARRIWLDAWVFAAGLAWLVWCACPCRSAAPHGGLDDDARLRNSDEPRASARAAVCFRTCHRIVHTHIDDSAGQAWTLLIWSALLLGPLFVALPLDWDRYYLPGLIASTAVQAHGLAWLSGWLAGRRRNV